MLVYQRVPWHDNVILPIIFPAVVIDPLDCTGLISFYPAFSIFKRPGAHPKPRNMTPGQTSRLRPGGVGGDCQRSGRRLGGAETLEDGWVQTKMGEENTQQPTSVLERSTTEITNSPEIQAGLEFHCGTSLCLCNMLVQWSALAEEPYPVDSIFDHQLIALQASRSGLKIDYPWLSIGRSSFSPYFFWLTWINDSLING